MTTTSMESEARSVTAHTLVALGLIAIVVGGFTWYAATAEIAGAVITSGSAVVESYPKRIQHQDGGTVAQVLVRDNEPVVAGQLLLRLDDTSLKATVALAEEQLAEGALQQARLHAELLGQKKFDQPAELSALDKVQGEALMDAEQNALVSELAARDGRISQLREQVAQLESEIEGLGVQKAAAFKQIELIQSELEGVNSLSDQKLILVSKVNDLSKQEAAQQGEAGRLAAAIAQARATIAERQYQIDQIESDFISRTLGTLQKARETAASARQQLAVASQKLVRTEIRAPQSGVVHESIVHTVGGVVSPGETIMEIVPVSDSLLFDLRVDPNDIDQVQAGQDARIRLTSFDSRSTPELRGRIETVSPDYVQLQNQRPYYTASVRVGPDELHRLPDDVHLRPGIPAEGFVVTENRTILSYLVRPFVEQLQLAMRDGR